MSNNIELLNAPLTQNYQQSYTSSSSSRRSPSAPSCFCSCYTRTLYRARWLVLLIWLLVLCFGVWLGPRFLQKTHDEFTPPSGSPSAIAGTIFQQHFPLQAATHSIIVVLKSPAPLLNDTNAMLYGQYINDQLYQHFINSTDPSPYESLSSFYMTLHSDLPEERFNFLSFSNCSMFFLLSYRTDTSVSKSTIVTAIRDYVDSLIGFPPYSVGVTGDDLLSYDIGQGTGDDMIHVDSIVLPLAMCVLMLYLKSLRLMIIPLIAVVLSLASAFTIMLPMALYVWNIASFSPSIMMSLTLAMSIDYSLFILTRYREEVLKLERQEKESLRSKLERADLASHSFHLHPLQIAVCTTIHSSGEVIVVSGMTLCVTFCGLMFFPMSFLRSIGMASAVSILMCLCVNLTLTPTLLFLAPKFFANFLIYGWVRKVLPRLYTEDIPLKQNSLSAVGLDDAFIYSPDNTLSSQSQQSELDLSDDLDDSKIYHTLSNRAQSPPIITQPPLTKHQQVQLKSFWFRSARCSTTPLYAALIIVLVAAASIPFLISVPSLSHTIDATQLFPRNSRSLAVYREVQRDFSPGLIAHYNILMDTPVNQTIMNDDYFNVNALLVADLIASNFVSNQSVTAITYAQFTYINYNLSQVLLDPKATSQISKEYKYLFHSHVDSHASSSLIVIQTDFDPLSDAAEPWVRNLRTLLAHYTASTPYTFYLTGGVCESIDTVDKVYQLFPIVILITVGVVLLIVVVVFRSLFIPLRLLLTIALPISWVYGLAIWVFQENRADFVSSTLSTVHSLYWLTPVMSFSILVGLALDYDIFLLSRIIEYRRMGYSDKACITKGVYKTGSIITGAGVIMAIAFAGLMLSSEMVLNEFGFMLCFAVIFDTFIIRTLLVPAILSFAGRWNWWPYKMPPANKDELDHSDDEEEDGADQQYVRGKYGVEAKIAADY